VHVVRQRLYIVLFVIGLTMLISGVAVAIEGPNVMVKWHPRSGALLEDAVTGVSGCMPLKGHCIPSRKTYPWQYSILFNISRGAADFRVEGNITEIDGHRFYFAAFHPSYYDSWPTDGSTPSVCILLLVT
jgi:hypothetical protein